MSSSPIRTRTVCLRDSLSLRPGTVPGTAVGAVALTPSAASAAPSSGSWPSPPPSPPTLLLSLRFRERLLRLQLRAKAGPTLPSAGHPRHCSSTGLRAEFMRRFWTKFVLEFVFVFWFSRLKIQHTLCCPTAMTSRRQQLELFSVHLIWLIVATDRCWWCYS